MRRVVSLPDGTVHRLAGVANRESMVLSVPPSAFAAVAFAVRGVSADGTLRDRVALGRSLPAALDTGRAVYAEGALRVGEPFAGPDVGQWRRADELALPAGIHGRDALVSTDNHGVVTAAVGVQPLNSFGARLSLWRGTADPTTCTALLGQASRRTHARGLLPLFVCDHDDLTAAAAADAAGLPDSGWRWIWLQQPQPDVTAELPLIRVARGSDRSRS
jgi:hypothetical protein